MSFATRLLLTTVALVALTVGALTYGAERGLRRSLESTLAAEMEREARLIGTMLGRQPSAPGETARRLGRLIGHRITLLDTAGTVLGDSDFDDQSVALLGSHRDRPEIAEALGGRVGVSRRYSTSTHRMELKVAVPGGPGAVRLSAPVADIDTIVAGTQRAILLAGLAALAVGAAVAAALGRTIQRPLEQLAAAAGQLARGAPVELPRSQAPELRAVTMALRDLQQAITARVAALERRQRESETLIDSMAEGVVAADIRGSVRWCNPAARRLLGYDADAAIPNLRELFHQRELREVVAAVYGGEAVSGREVDINGRTVLATARPLPHGGAILGLLDVTDLKRLQTVRRDFVANVSHELKTPLTSILGYAETLLRDAPDDRTQQQFLATIHKNAERMQRLVDDLLDLARLEAGGWQPSLEHVSLEAIAQEAWGDYADRAAAKSVTLRLDTTPDVDLVADREALREVLGNLFDNALRHTGAGGTVTVRAVREADAVALQISDTGSGIPAEHVPRVFERFYRADPGRSRAGGGTGLGLSIVKHLVEAHGGRVGIASEVGRGTTVELRFPVAR